MFVTFYSYKGGVGRTQALANTAVALANEGKRVILVDFDLESPGIHHYFRHPDAPDQSMNDESLANRDGLLEFLSACAELPEEEPDCRPLLLPCTHPLLRGGGLQILPAGRLDDTYPRRLAAFSWERFYTEAYGADFLELLRVQLKSTGADYVFVDSRTGVTDAGLVCTFQLPDVLVLLFALHGQGVEGARRMLSTVAERRRKGTSPTERPYHVLVLPSRVDETGEMATLQYWLKQSEEQLGGITGLDYTLLHHIGKRIPYLPQAAFGEQIVVDPDAQRTILSESYFQLSNILVDLRDGQAPRQRAPNRLQQALPTRDLLLTQYQEVRSLFDHFKDSVDQLRTHVKEKGDIRTLLYRADLLRRDQSRLDQAIHALGEGCVLLGRRLRLELEPDLVSPTTTLTNVGAWEKQLQQLNEFLARISDQQTELREDAHRQLHEAAAGDEPAYREHLATVEALIQNAELEKIDEILEEVTVQLREASLKRRLTRNELDHATLAARFPSRRERTLWLDDHLREVLEGGFAVEEKGGKLPLWNLLRLRVMEMEAPNHRDWDAYGALCLQLSATPGDDEAVFSGIGARLWELDWKARLADKTPGRFRSPAGKEGHGQLVRLAGRAPQALTPIVDLLTTWMSSKLSELNPAVARTWFLPVFRDRGDDPCLLAAVRRMVSDPSNPIESRHRLAAFWLDNEFRQNRLLNPEVLAALMSAAVDCKLAREALVVWLSYAQVQGHDPSQNSNENGSHFVTPELMMGMWSSEPADQVLVLGLLEAFALREILWQTEAGRIWLVAVTGELIDVAVPEHLSELRRWLLYEASSWSNDRLWGSLRRWLEQRDHYPTPLSDTYRSDRALTKARERLDPTFYGDWPSSQQYTRDFRETFEPFLNEILSGRSPAHQLEERLNKLSPGEWIRQAQRRIKKRHGGLLRAPEGSARTNVDSAFQEMRQALLALNARRGEVGTMLSASTQVWQDRMGLRVELTTYLQRSESSSLAKLGEWLQSTAVPGMDGAPVVATEPLLKTEGRELFRSLVDSLALDPLLIRRPTFGDRSSCQRFLEDLLAYRAGIRDHVVAAEDYLAADEFVLVARCLSVLSQHKKAADLGERARLVWEQRRSELGEALDNLQRSAERIKQETTDSLPELATLEELVADAAELAGLLPTGPQLWSELANHEDDGLTRLRDQLELARLAHEEVTAALERVKHERIERLKTLKKRADEAIDEMLFGSSPEAVSEQLFGPSPETEFGAAIEALQQQVLLCARYQDAAGLEDVVRQIEAIRDGGPSPEILEAIQKSSQTPISSRFERRLDVEHLEHKQDRPCSVEDEPGRGAPSTPASVSPYKRDWKRLGAFSDASLTSPPGGEAALGDDPKTLLWSPPRLYASAHDNDLSRTLTCARQYQNQPEGEAALAMYLVLEGRQRLEKREFRLARGLFADALYFLFSPPSLPSSTPWLELESWQEEAFLGLLGAILLSMPGGLAMTPSAELATQLRRISLRTLLERIEDKAGFAPVAWFLVEAGFPAAERIIERFLLPYFGRRTVSGFDLALELASCLREAHVAGETALDLFRPGGMGDTARIVLHVIGRVFEALDATPGELARWFLRAADALVERPSVTWREVRTSLTDAIARLEPLGSDWGRVEEICAVLRQTVDSPAGGPVSPVLTHSLLTREVFHQSPDPHLVVELKFNKGVQRLRDLQTEVTLLRDAELEIRQAVQQPPITLQLKPGQRTELRIPLDPDMAGLDQARSLRVRHSLRPHRGTLTMFDRIEPGETFELTIRAGKRFHDPTPLNPYVFGRAILNQDLFFGREHEQNEIRRLLIGQEQDNIVLVVGERRIGKTSLLNAFQQDFEVKRRYVPFYVDLENLGESPVDLFRDLLTKPLTRHLQRLGMRTLPALDNAEFESRPHQAFQQFMLELDEYLERRDKRVLLLIDEIEKLFETVEQSSAHSGEMDGKVIATLRAVMQRTHRISYILSGVTGTVRRYMSRRNERLFKLASEIPVKPLDDKAARDLIRKPVGRVYNVSAPAADLLLRETARQPYLLQLVGHALFEYVIEHQLAAVTVIHVEEVFENRILTNPRHFTYLTDELRDEADFQLVHGIAALQRGNRYVRVAELSSWLEREDRQVPSEDVKKRLERLAQEAELVVERQVGVRDGFRLAVGLYARHLRRVHGL